jgi:hypothetical protein
VPLPEVAPGQRWRNIFTGEAVTTVEACDGSIRAAEVFQNFPVALLLAER